MSLQQARDKDFENWRDAMLAWKEKCESDFALRDHFAAAALTGLLADGEWPANAEAQAAEEAYAHADAMLRERANNSEKPNSCGPAALPPESAWPSHIRPRAPSTPQEPPMYDPASTPQVHRKADSVKWINFNANDYVRVKLTQHGHDVLKRQHEHLNAVTACLPYRPPEEDSDGWSKWQLHRLMNHFGAHTGMGLPLCFLPCIQFSAVEANHDAAPAARASDERPRTDKADLPSRPGTGDTQEPVAWAVVYPTNEVAVIAFKLADADERASASDRVVPLYRSPTLTEAEREAVEWCVEMAATTATDCADEIAALRGLLERMK